MPGRFDSIPPPPPPPGKKQPGPPPLPPQGVPRVPPAPPPPGRKPPALPSQPTPAPHTPPKPFSPQEHWKQLAEKQRKAQETQAASSQASPQKPASVSSAVPKAATSAERTAPPKPEKVEHELSPEEEVLFEMAAAYGNMNSERARMTTELREAARKFREDGLFAVQVYGEVSNDAGIATHDPDKLKKLGRYYIFHDLNIRGENEVTSQHENTAILKRKEEEGYVEALGLHPIITHTFVDEPIMKEKSGWFGKTKKVPTGKTIKVSVGERLASFKEVAPKHNLSDPAMRLTYHVSARSRYKTNLMTHEVGHGRFVPKTQSVIKYMLGNTMHQPVPLPGASRAEELRTQISDTLAMTELARTVNPLGARPGNQVAVSVVLTKARAEELLKYFERHPDQIRPFFVFGGLDKMVPHIAPPFKELDGEKPHRPILVHRYDDHDKFSGKSEIKT